MNFSFRLTKQTINQIGIDRQSTPKFNIGDCIAISLKIKEGDKERVQLFEGDVIAMHNNGISSTFSVRKIGAGGIAIERIFPLYSPAIADIKLVHRGDVRRAKLYYMRDRIGKAARVAEKVLTKNQKEEAKNRDANQK